MMRQIVLQQPGEFAERQVPPPRRAPDQALVRVRRIGVCGTDLHAFAGNQPFFTYPRVLGHELGVEVAEAPPNKRGIGPGDRCALDPYLSCGKCRPCRLQRPNCCDNLRILGVHVDGGMQPLLAVPLELLHKSEKLTTDQLALVETLGIGFHAIERAELRAGEDALVVGAGPIGLAVAQFAQAAGAKVTILELDERRREFAAGLGVEALPDAGGRVFSAVFDATGNAAAMEASFDRVAAAGRLILVGLVKGRVSFDDPAFHRRELAVLSSRNSCFAFPKIIEMIEQGHIDTAPWINRRLPLGRVPGEFGELRRIPGLIKAIVEVEE